MAGLIPLTLKAASPSGHTHVAPLSSQFRVSDSGSLTVTSNTPEKRSATAFLDIPTTSTEWRRAIAEIKRQHVAKKHRSCSARCREILDNVDERTVEPIHMIYLHFYAATSLEICARPLFETSSYRATLLQQARTHFDRAAELIQAAEDSVADKMRASSRASTCRSPFGSVSSQAWSSETHTSSPASSVCSFEDAGSKPTTPSSQPNRKPTKKVCFSLPSASREAFRMSTIVVRPDSPTLGFEDTYFQAGADLSRLPDPPKSAEVELDLPIQRHDNLDDDTPLDNEPDEEDEFFVAMTNSFHRYCEHLAGLRIQIAIHTASLDAVLKPVSSRPGTPEVVLSQLDGRRSEASSRAHHRASSVGLSDELRLLDRQARIERLRQVGWQRKRFDATRYEQLCESAMAELQ